MLRDRPNPIAVICGNKICINQVPRSYINNTKTQEHVYMTKTLLFC